VATLALFVYVILHWALQALIWLVIISVILSWLVGFEIINLRNRTAYNIVRLIDGATQPLLRPIRRVIPPLGGLDLSPMIFVVVLGAVDTVLLPALVNAIAIRFG
jgi:YggT family protein